MIKFTVFGRPFVKGLALCYQTVRCLSVCDVGALSPNGWMDQDETWHAGRPRPWPHCVGWGPSTPPPKEHRSHQFSPYLLRPNGCMDQDATWYGGRPQPRGLVLDRDPTRPLIFRSMFIIVIAISLEHCIFVISLFKF